MPLQSGRFSGDPVLEKCQAGTHRMLTPETNLSVMRVQEALTTVGFSTNGLDGIFGADTGVVWRPFAAANRRFPFVVAARPWSRRCAQSSRRLQTCRGDSIDR
jgi:hypothetical protein